MLRSVWSVYKGKNAIGAKYHYVSLYPKISELNEEYYEELIFWSSFVLRGLPQKLNQVMLWWLWGFCSIELIYHEPSAKELLVKQSMGSRYVTLFTEDSLPENLEQRHGKDNFYFVIHDLIHAYEFFHNPMQKYLQQIFYQVVLPEYDVILSGLTINGQEQFHYLVSDMNTHSAHQWEYLFSLVERCSVNPSTLNFLRGVVRRIQLEWKVLTGQK
jgi:hypothetical protein